MNKSYDDNLRSILFRHLDGIALCCPISVLNKNGVLNYIKNNPEFNIQDVLSEYKCNSGYINISLRLLSSQGWLIQKILNDGESINYNLTKKGTDFLALAKHYNKFAKSFKLLINIDQYLYKNTPKKIINEIINLIDLLKSLNIKSYQEHSTEWEIIKHLEGVIVGPILVSLGMTEYFKNNSKFKIDNKNLPLLKIIIDFFIYLDWLKEDKNYYKFTYNGNFYIKRSSAYGVTVSYMPTFNNSSELLFGNPNILWKRNLDGFETHVNRRMNVWGSGGAHSLYFKKIDEIITEIFNQPIDKQPIGIADMGCGDGTMLKHLYNVVKNNTIRGDLLDKYPLKIIGADFNKAARLASSLTLNKANIKHSILNGDISNPSEYAQNLKHQFNINLNDMLSVRSFLDHNRIYAQPKENYNNIQCNSSGAFAFRGRWIPNKELKQNLIEHFSSWSNYVSKYGLLILELHTISPSITAKNLGRTVATAYDATHGFSDQYIIEANIMIEAAKNAGLEPIKKYTSFFPNKDIATISINLFRSI